MENFPLRSPAVKVGGLIYFGRMLDKIRTHAKGDLPADYQPNLGKGFDSSCAEFLGIDYGELVARTKAGGTDEEILNWCFTTGTQPTEAEMHVWNEYMRKRAGTMKSPKR